MCFETLVSETHSFFKIICRRLLLQKDLFSAHREDDTVKDLIEKLGQSEIYEKKNRSSFIRGNFEAALINLGHF